MKSDIKPRLTVVIPTFNRRYLLERAIESVIAQNCPQAIIHVWDNHSTDDTERYMRELTRKFSWIYYTRRPSNIGAVANYVDGIAKVETEFYVGLGDDDLFYPNFLSTGLEAFDRDGSLGAVIMQTVHKDPDGAEQRINPDERWKYGKMEPRQMMEQWAQLGHLEWSSIIFRKSAHDAAGGVDKDIGLATDVDFQMQVFLRYPVFLIRQKAAVYTLHAEQQSSNLGLLYVRTAAEVVKRLQKASEMFKEFKPAVKALRRRYARDCSGLGWKYRSGKELRFLLIVITFQFRSPWRTCACVLRALLSHTGYIPPSMRRLKQHFASDHTL